MPEHLSHSLNPRLKVRPQLKLQRCIQLFDFHLVNNLPFVEIKKIPGLYFWSAIILSLLPRGCRICRSVVLLASAVDVIKRPIHMPSATFFVLVVPLGVLFGPSYAPILRRCAECRKARSISPDGFKPIAKTSKTCPPDLQRWVHEPLRPAKAHIFLLDANFTMYYIHRAAKGPWRKL